MTSDIQTTETPNDPPDSSGATMSIDQFSTLSLAEIQTALAARDLSPIDLARTMLDQIEAVNGTINALYDVNPERVLSEAAKSEERYARKATLSPFDGIPVTIKDSVHAVGMNWHHGSAIYGNGVVGRQDAPPAEALKRAGAIILGKGIMPDFGLSGSGASGSHGLVRNPWGLDWNTGGSSAGAGASLAAGIGMMSVGSDIAGSVRLPASHCGLAALKPTQGVVPHAPASTVRSAGAMTRYAKDLHAWTKLLSGPHRNDRHSLPFLEDIPDGEVRVGVTADFGFGPEVEAPVLACLLRARTIIAAVVPEVVDLDQKAGFDAYLPIDDTLKIRGWLEYAAADPEARLRAPKQLVDWFAEAESWSIEKVHKVDQGIERCVAFANDLLDDVDVLLTPVMPIVNFPVGDRGIDPEMPLRHTTFTAPFNQSGHPAVSLCGGFDERGLPIGIQLVGKRFDDARLLQLAARLESALDVHESGARKWPTSPS